MNTKVLTAVGIGDVPNWLANDGLTIAQLYFENNGLDPVECYKANSNGTNCELAAHWVSANKKANQVLLSDDRYQNSMIYLEFE